MKFVVLHYFPAEPVQVHGTFDTEEAAHAYAEAQNFAIGFGAYDVHAVREPFEAVRDQMAFAEMTADEIYTRLEKST